MSSLLPFEVRLISYVLPRYYIYAKIPFRFLFVSRHTKSLKNSNLIEKLHVIQKYPYIIYKSTLFDQTTIILFTVDSLQS